ncbi:cerebral cavernous malformations protein 2 homolog [Patiria miniata]|uniref:PID domain-containing protein n=1 Tax=Patiria miniata TaxID=46514 RepID=A0A914A0V0_PATMI|nr:cerebral cavernous malformations protein 2 homolog [Patiria miniata]XP_038057508.1 cerebral cavernous malformations protein 2 homolog [Patiria miniata]
MMSRCTPGTSHQSVYCVFSIVTDFADDAGTLKSHAKREPHNNVFSKRKYQIKHLYILTVQVMGMEEDIAPKSSSKKQGGLLGLFNKDKDKDKDKSRVGISRHSHRESRESHELPSQMPHHHTILEGRRPLKTMELSPPEYKVDPQILIDSFLEIAIKYLGVIPNVPYGLDPTKRTELLRIIDKGKKKGLLPWSTRDNKHDAILSVSAKQIKVVKRDGEETLVRLPIHDIAAVSYVRDDGQHLVMFKIATDNQQEQCNLVVFECRSKESADEVCALAQQIFYVVYTELTMKYFDQSIIRAARNTSLGSVSRSVVSRTALDPDVFQPPPSSTASSEYPSSPALRPSNSMDDLSVTAKVLLQEYIEVLRSKLSSDELQQFAAILRDYRQTGSIKEFCSRLQTLYGPERKLLFPGMRPYIPEKDIDFFENTLERMGIQDAAANGYYYTSPQRSRRTNSEASSSIGGFDMGLYSHSIMSERDELDRALQDICNEVEHLETSVDS